MEYCNKFAWHTIETINLRDQGVPVYLEKLFILSHGKADFFSRTNNRKLFFNNKLITGQIM